jgi:hypothetical protein
MSARYTNDLTVMELKEELKRLGLSVHGLQERVNSMPE